jgi:two-component system, cell cycle sensor histidine kinase and response regulator CckA
VHDGRGGVEKIVGTLRDITEAKEMERKRLEFEAKMERTQRMEALGTLAGGIAHDINNTLMPVVALTKMMMKKLPEGVAERAKLELIHSAGCRSRDLVRQILAFSRKEKPSKSALDLDHAVHETLEMLRAMLPTTIQIEYEAEPGLAPILGDGGQMHQVIVNLVTNAAHAIGSKIGNIKVSVAGTEFEVRDPNGPRRQPALRLSVEDTGCGMDEATMKRVFEPFFTTKTVGEGTGLGLAVVHGIVTSHGGRIDIKSEVGAGTRFDVVLPTMQASVPVLEEVGSDGV